MKYEMFETEERLVDEERKAEDLILIKKGVKNQNLNPNFLKKREDLELDNDLLDYASIDLGFDLED